MTGRLRNANYAKPVIASNNQSHHCFGFPIQLLKLVHSTIYYWRSFSNLIRQVFSYLSLVRRDRGTLKLRTCLHNTKAFVKECLYTSCDRRRRVLKAGSYGCLVAPIDCGGESCHFGHCQAGLGQTWVHKTNVAIKKRLLHADTHPPTTRKGPKPSIQVGDG